MLVLSYQKLKYRNTNLFNVKINQGSKRAYYTWHWNKYKEVCHNLTKINEGEPKSYRIFKMFMLVIAEIYQTSEPMIGKSAAEVRMECFITTERILARTIEEINEKLLRIPR